MSEEKGVVVAVSGGFDPAHVGHVRMFKRAKAFGQYLVVILNNDNWLMKKKGYVFMHQKERKEIIEALWMVNAVVITGHPKNPKDMSVCAELKRIRPNVFCNGGDRTKKNVPEDIVCKKLGIRMEFNVGGSKVRSSSDLVRRAREHGCC